MKVKELKMQLEEFQKELEQHSFLWRQSLDRTIPDYPIRNIENLRQQQSCSLSRARKAQTLLREVFRQLGDDLCGNRC